MTISLFITEEDVSRYARWSGDFNQIHINKKIANEKGFKDCVVHGALIMNLALSIIKKQFKNSLIVESYEVCFYEPLYVNEEAYLIIEEVSKPEVTFTILKGNQKVLKGKILAVFL